MVILYIAFVLGIAAERLLELRISNRNAARAFDRGGVEVGHAHFRFMTVLHTSFLVSCVLEVTLLQREIEPTLALSMILLALAAQVLRWWAIHSLGDAWNVRVIVVPERPAVTAGPYRYLRHPNYLAVMIEGVAIPLAGGAWITALCFTIANALLLSVRVRCEEDLLTRTSNYESAFFDRRRFIPTIASKR